MQQNFWTRSYIFPSNNGATPNAEYVNNSVHSSHHQPIFLLSDCDIHTDMHFEANYQLNDACDWQNAREFIS